MNRLDVNAVVKGKARRPTLFRWIIASVSSLDRSRISTSPGRAGGQGRGAVARLRQGLHPPGRPGRRSRPDLPDRHRRERHDLVPRVAQQERGHGAVDTAAHRHRDAVACEWKTDVAEAARIPLLERTRDRASLFDAACRVAVEDGGNLVDAVGKQERAPFRALSFFL